MDSSTVYIKTDLGQEEIATRARHVPARLRALLIMIDGRRSVGELLANHPAPDEARGYLESLAEGGFIAAANASAKPVPAAVPSAARAPAVAEDLSVARQVLSRTLIDFIGPDADMFLVRVEKVTTKADLAVEAEKLRKMLEGSVGPAKAEKFREAVFPLLV